MIITREDLAAEVDSQGRLYAVGGFGGYLKTCLSSIERFDPVTNTWVMLTEMQTTRRAPGCAIVGSKLFVFGGHDGSRYLSSGDVYDLAGNSWSRIAKMSEEKCMFSVSVDRESREIFVLGGFRKEALGTAEVFSVSAGKWSVLRKMPDRRYMHCSLIGPDCLINNTNI